MVVSILINGHQHPEKWLWAFLQMVVNILTLFRQYSFLWPSVFWQLASNTQHLHNEEGTVDCQQLKWTGGRSPGCSVNCNDFIPTASMHNMTGGGTWHITIWSWTAGWQGAGTCSPERLIPVSPTATVLGPAVHVGRTWNWALNCGRKRMGASRLEHSEPHGCSPGWLSSFTARWTFSWGLAWDYKGSKYMKAQHWAGGHATGACWAPRAVHRDRWLHRRLLPQLGAYVDDINAASMPEPTWVLNCLQELKIRHVWTTLSGLKWAAGHMLVALSALRQWGSMCISLNY
jgi:hypothetical protein